MGMQNIQKLESRIFDSHLSYGTLKCLYVEAIHLQCSTLGECALFRKLVLLACRVWPLLFFLLSVSVQQQQQQMYNRPKGRYRPGTV